MKNSSGNAFLLSVSIYMDSKAKIVPTHGQVGGYKGLKLNLSSGYYAVRNTLVKDFPLQLKILMTH